MVLIITTIILSLAALTLFYKMQRNKLRPLKEELLNARDRVTALKASISEITAKEQKLDTEMDCLLAVYSLMSELSKSYDEADIIQTYQQELKKRIGLNCSVVKNKPSCLPESQAVYPITVDDQLFGYFMAEPIDLNRELILITLNQLSMALKRSGLYHKIQELSITDTLTSTFNRRHFLERFAQEFQRAGLHKLHLSVLMLDIDYFKSYNDTFSHMVGDELLKEVARKIKECLRRIDMCARWGGEEFMVLLPDTPPKGAYQVAQRLRKKIEQAKMNVFGEILSATISIGAASFPDDCGSQEDLLEKADQALYKAKNNGRNNVFSWQK